MEAQNWSLKILDIGSSTLLLKLNKKLFKTPHLKYIVFNFVSSGIVLKFFKVNVLKSVTHQLFTKTSEIETFKL